jgi:predicted small lipoprotein YifL
MMKLMFSALAFVALAACATTPPAYTPAASASAAGYSETQIEANRYFVTYRAPGAADAALIEDYALRRAAELTLLNGREWFWVDRRTIEDDQGRRSGPSVGVGVGGSSWGGNTGVGVGVGLNFPLGGGGGPRARAATLEIRFGEGPKPDEPNAYDARAVDANLRARGG